MHRGTRKVGRGRSLRHRLGGRCEPLERRRLLAAITWDGGGDAVSWNSANNWSNNLLPTSADDVTLGGGAGTVVLTGTASTVKSLITSRPLTVSVTSLQIDSAATFGAAVKVDSSGSINIGGTCALNNTLTLGDATSNSQGALQFISTTASQTLSGTGTISAVGDALSYVINFTINSGVGRTLTIGSGITMSGKSLQVYSGFSGGTIVNSGTITPNVSGGNWIVNSVTNNGSIT